MRTFVVVDAVKLKALVCCSPVGHESPLNVIEGEPRANFHPAGADCPANHACAQGFP